MERSCACGSWVGYFRISRRGAWLSSLRKQARRGEEAFVVQYPIEIFVDGKLYSAQKVEGIWSDPRVAKFCLYNICNRNWILSSFSFSPSECLPLLAKLTLQIFSKNAYNARAGSESVLNYYSTIPPTGDFSFIFHFNLENIGYHQVVWDTYLNGHWKVTLLCQVWKENHLVLIYWPITDS